MQINLLPVQYKPKPAVRFWPVLLTIVLMLNLLIISSYWLSLQLELNSAQSSLSAIENEVSSLQRQVDEAEWKAQLADTVSTKRDYIKLEETESILWFPLLEAIERAMLPGIALTTINSSDSGEIGLSGTPGTITDVANFLGSLQAETGLEIVHLLGVTPEESFQINLSGWYGREVQEDE